MEKIVILGAGESGTGAAILAKQKGFEVFVSDKGAIKENYKQELDAQGIRWEEGKHTEEEILAAKEIIKSPGIPETVPMVKKALEKGIPVIDEIEFAARYTKGKIIGITGTNGKTTTTSLIFHVLEKAQLDVGLGGNIGKSFARQVAAKDRDYWVLELSSFQLDGMYRTRVHVAVLCNITPDHLDRYGERLENYVRSKFRITQNQEKEDHFIYCAEDEITIENLKEIRGNAQQWPFAIDKQPSLGAWIRDKILHVNLTPNPTNTMTFLLEEFALKGRHNWYNSMAAAIVANALSIRKEVIRDSFADFKNVEHRLENIGLVRGVEFINDSKATNVNSAWYALESMENPVIWIAGGVDKGNDYSALKSLVREKVKIIVCLGTDNRKIHEAFARDVKMIINTSAMNEAVNISYRLAEKGDTILLSPACASFDLFQNYEDRGRQFKKAVRNL